MQRYAIQASDYGAAVGWRLAVAHPERSQAWNTQKYFPQGSAVRNGNFYGSRIDPTPSTGN
jgi:hypothetical protein